MVKIKNWKKLNKVGNLVWETNNVILKIIFERDKWVLVVKDMAPVKPKIVKFFKTKQEALDYAINYMRSNPNG
jgi:hypothetical protein